MGILFVSTVSWTCAQATYSHVPPVVPTLVLTLNSSSRTSQFLTVSTQKRLNIWWNKLKLKKKVVKNRNRLSQLSWFSFASVTLTRRQNISVKMTKSWFALSALLLTIKDTEWVTLGRTEVSKCFSVVRRFLRKKLMLVLQKQKFFLKSFKKLKTNYR